MNSMLNHENVGRNSPCPCGSGIKYKRCCAKQNGISDLLQRFGLKAPPEKAKPPQQQPQKVVEPSGFGSFNFTPMKRDPLCEIRTAATSCGFLKGEPDVLGRSFAPMFLGGFLKSASMYFRDYVINSQGSEKYSKLKQRMVFLPLMDTNTSNKRLDVGVEDLLALFHSEKALLASFNSSRAADNFGEFKIRDLMQILAQGTFQLGKIEPCREEDRHLEWGHAFTLWKQHPGAAGLLKIFFHNNGGGWDESANSPMVKINTDQANEILAHEFIVAKDSPSLFSKLAQQEILCFVCNWEGHQIALGIASSFFFLPGAARFFKLWSTQVGGTENFLISQIESLSDTTTWRLLIGFPKQAYINALIEEIYEEADNNVLRITKNVRAAVLASKMRREATGKPLLLSLLSALEAKEGEELRAAFIALWDACINFCCPHSLLPEGKTILKALFPILQATKEPKPGRAEPTKKVFTGPASHWRMRRENIATAELNDLQLINACRKLENYAASEIKNRELGIKRPVITFVRGNTETEIIFNMITNEILLPIRYLEYTWEVLCDVVEWGLAHALADEYQKSCATETAAYEMAWNRLNLQPCFRMQRKRMNDIPLNWKESANAGDDTERRFLEKIDKLFALGSSSNEAEAALAMQRAHEMLASRNISRHKSGQGGQRDMVRLVLHLDSPRLDSTTSYITAILMDFYYVRVIYGTEWDIAQQIDARCLYVLGRRENVLMAEHVFDFLSYKINSLWQDALRAKALPRKAKLSYQVGLLKGFRAKLEAMVAMRSAGTKADTEKSEGASLIQLEGIDVDNYVNAEFPKLGNMQKKGIKLHSQGFNAGISDGADIVIHEPLKGAPADKTETRFLN